MKRVIVPLAVIVAGMLQAASATSATHGSEGPSAPVEFSGRIADGTEIVSAAPASVEGHSEVRGRSWTFDIVEMSDTRLEGTATHTHNIDDYGDVLVFASAWRIENEAGAWEGTEHSVILPNGERTRSSIVLVGEGDYEGLTALAEVTFDQDVKEFRGIIIDGAAPPVPDGLRIE